jgi:uncharacterized protein YcbK (DUF882 family)
MSLGKLIKEAYTDKDGEVEKLSVMATIVFVLYLWIFIKAEAFGLAFSSQILESIVTLLNIAVGAVGVGYIGKASGVADTINRMRGSKQLNGAIDSNTPKDGESSLNDKQTPKIGQLTKDFVISEFDCNDGTKVPEALMGNIHELAKNLQVLRDHYGKPITINSAYRTPWYNSKVGGAAASKHMEGKAADINVQGITPKALHTTIEGLIESGKMKQGGLGLYPTFVHYDVRGSYVRWRG